MTKPETTCCSLCLAESGIFTPANVEWPGPPICRQHFAESHMRALGIAPYPVDVMVDAPAMLQ
jgi:hypothetical protein